MLNTKQRSTFNYAIKKAFGAFLIVGHAGCGKTYLAIKIIEHKLKQGKKILVLTPTHQAKQQFSSKLKAHKNLELTTVAAFLKQFPTAGETGELVFGKGGFGGFDGDMIVVDELSMVSEHETIEILKAKKHSQVIMLGDFAQLLPVMKAQGTIYQKLKTFTLTEQQRNAGPILKLADKARNEIVYPQVTVEDDTGSVIVHKNKTLLVEKFLLDLEASKRPYDVCYLAYRNKTVAKVRALAHEVLYGQKPFVKRQYIRLDQPCMIGNNGSIIKVLKVNGKEKTKIGGLNVILYNLNATNPSTKEWGVISVVDPDTQILLKERLEELYQLSGKAFKRNKEDWEEYQSKIKEIRRVTFHSSPFCQTCHKSQGRSIPRVYVDTYDISTGSGKRRLLYVSYSRAMDELHTIKIKSKK